MNTNRREFAGSYCCSMRVAPAQNPAMLSWPPRFSGDERRMPNVSRRSLVRIKWLLAVPSPNGGGASPRLTAWTRVGALKSFEISPASPAAPARCGEFVVRITSSAIRLLTAKMSSWLRECCHARTRPATANETRRQASCVLFMSRLERVAPDRASRLLVRGVKGVGATGGTYRNPFYVKRLPEQIVGRRNCIRSFGVLDCPGVFGALHRAEVVEATGTAGASAGAGVIKQEHRVQYESKCDRQGAPPESPRPRIFFNVCRFHASGEHRRERKVLSI